MTFIVAKQVGHTIIALADTKLSPELNKTWSIISQANKLVCLSSQWVLAYAGNTHVVDKTLKDIQSYKFAGFSTLQELLIAANRESIGNGSSTDFLLIGTQTRAIHKFTNGDYHRIQGNTAWLGNKSAFEKYQELNHLPPNTTHPLLQRFTGTGSDGYDIAPLVVDEKRKEVERRMDRIVKALIEDAGSPEVGGFPISIVIHNGIARYWPRAGRILAVPPGGLPPNSLRDQVFGNAEFGDFQFDIITAWDSEQNTVAVYFRTIQKALVFRRWDGGLPYAKLIDDISSENAALCLERLYNCPMWQVRVTKVGEHRIEVDASPPGAKKQA